LPAGLAALRIDPPAAADGTIASLAEVADRLAAEGFRRRVALTSRRDLK